MSLAHARIPTPDWSELVHRANPEMLDEHAYRSGPLVVISSVGIMDLPGEPAAAGPTWHISITHSRRRPTDTQLRRALRAFGMIGAEEDNHHPGAARHFFLPVDPARRGICECKATEETIREPDGYEWTNPKDGACRGCELQR